MATNVAQLARRALCWRTASLMTASVSVSTDIAGGAARRGATASGACSGRKRATRYDIRLIQPISMIRKTNTVPIPSIISSTPSISKSVEVIIVFPKQQRTHPMGAPCKRRLNVPSLTKPINQMKHRTGIFPRRKKTHCQGTGFLKMAHSEGFEPSTARFVAEYSIQLSYECVVGAYYRAFYLPVNLFFLFNSRNYLLTTLQYKSGGEGGIRTLDTLLRCTPLAGERLRPLGHLSVTRAEY